MIRVADVKAEIERMGALWFLKRLSPNATREGEKARSSCPICNSPNKRSMSASRKNDGAIVANCFVCGESGDALDITMKAKGLSFREALEFWAGELGLACDMPQPVQQSHFVQQSHCAARDDVLYDQVAERLIKLCPIHKQPDAKAYLQSRGLYEEATADGWGALPVAGNGEGTQQAIYYQLQNEFGRGSGRDKLDDGRKRLKASGVTRVFRCEQTGKWVHFPNNGHRLLIPWRRLDQTIAALQRRYIGPPPVGTEKVYFDKGTQLKDVLFGIHKLAPWVDDPSIAIELVEGATDVLARRTLLRIEGQTRIVLGLMSACAIVRDEWRSMFRGRDVYIATDNDDAGQKCLTRMHSELSRAGAKVRTLCPPSTFKDWAEYLESKVSL